jgi:hypothetical protein
MTGGSSGPASAGTPPTATPPTDVPARSRRSLRGLRPSWSTSLPPLPSDPRVARRPAGPPVPPRSLVDARDSLRSSSLGRAGPSPLRCSLPPGSRGGRPVPGPPGRPGARHGVVVGLTAEASLRVRTTTAGPDPRRRGQPAVARARSADHPTTTPGVGRRRPEADPETTEAVSTRPPRPVLLRGGSSGARGVPGACGADEHALRSTRVTGEPPPPTASNSASTRRPDVNANPHTTYGVTPQMAAMPSVVTTANTACNGPPTRT